MGTVLAQCSFSSRNRPADDSGRTARQAGRESRLCAHRVPQTPMSVGLGEGVSGSPAGTWPARVKAHADQRAEQPRLLPPWTGSGHSGLFSHNFFLPCVFSFV